MATARMRRIVVVGASLAGVRAAERLRIEGFDGSLVVLGEEPREPYDRPPLSKALLAGRAEPDTIALPRAEELDVEWLLGERAVALDLESRLIATSSGAPLAFDGLVIATGGAPRRLPALPPGPGIHELRTLDDALELRSALDERPRLAIVGAGFIGVEVASTARELGIEVTIVSLDRPLAVAGGLVSSIAEEQLLDHGVHMLLGRSVARGLGPGRVEALELDDGARIDADLVLVCVGAAPATGWLEGSGLVLDDGVVCDRSCAAVGVDGVVAAGDVARWDHPRFGQLRVEHWTNAAEQAFTAARALLLGSSPGLVHDAVPSFWSDHFGTRVQSVGLPGRGTRYEVVAGAVSERRFAAAAYRGEELVGAVAYGMPAALGALRRELTVAPAAEVGG